MPIDPTQSVLQSVHHESIQDGESHWGQDLLIKLTFKHKNQKDWLFSAVGRERGGSDDSRDASHSAFASSGSGTNG